MAIQVNTVGYSISASSCVADTTHTDFPFAVTVSVPELTVNDKATVVMAGGDADLFYEDGETVAGGIKLYAKNNTFGTAKISVLVIDKA